MPLQRRKSIFDFTPKERFKMLKEVNTAEKQSGVGTGNIESAAYHDEHELTIIFWGLGITILTPQRKNAKFLVPNAERSEGKSAKKSFASNIEKMLADPLQSF